MIDLLILVAIVSSSSFSDDCIFKLCWNNDLEGIRKISSSSSPQQIQTFLNYSDQLGSCTIHLASNYGRIDPKRWTPLFVAASHGHAVIVDLLLKSGADVNSVDNDGYSSILIASENGHIEVVDLFFEIRCQCRFS